MLSATIPPFLRPSGGVNGIYTQIPPRLQFEEDQMPAYGQETADEFANFAGAVLLVDPESGSGLGAEADQAARSEVDRDVGQDGCRSGSR